jgi:hypothetical protein
VIGGVALGALTAAVRRGAGAAELAPLRAALLQEAEEAGKAAAMGAK